MKVLLDTHIWIWHLLGSKELKKKYRDIIQDESNELWLSPISLWEIHHLIKRKRLPVKEDAAEWVSLALESLQVREARISFSIASLSQKLEMHSDPADRFIAATAMDMSLSLMTEDKRLRDLSGLTVV